MLLAVDRDEDFIDLERIAIATVLSLKSSGIERAELDAPQSYCFAADRNTSLGEKIFNIAMAEVEAIVEPDYVRNDKVFIERFWRSLKYDEVYLRTYVNMKDAFEHLGRNLVFCYSRRPHISLADLTPDAVYFENQRMVA